LINSHKKRIGLQLVCAHAILTISSFKLALNVGVAVIDCSATLLSATAGAGQTTLVCVVNGVYAVTIVILHFHWLNCVCSAD
jgi:hypothetical protein